LSISSKDGATAQRVNDLIYFKSLAYLPIHTPTRPRWDKNPR